MTETDDAWGITAGYFDVDGTWHPTSDETRARLRDAMGTPIDGPPMWFVPAGRSEPLWNPCRLVLEDGTDLGEVHALPPDLPPGYHDLHPLDSWPSTRVVVHPPVCHQLPRAWGVAVQTYALWSTDSWGCGDLRDLTTLLTSVATAGGGAALISPLHQPAPSLPQEDSPYYPSSRRAWNPLLLAMDGPPPAALRCRPDALIDRDVTWAAKRAALEQRFASLTDPPPIPDSIAIWNAVCDIHGPLWRSWPDHLRRYDREVFAAVLRDDRNLANRASFHQWIQTLLGDQLAGAAATGVDLIGDLAVGFAPNGADGWEFQDSLALDMRVGAPPDPFNEAGQEWGIAPFIPWQLRNAHYEPFIQTIRSVLRGVNGLRMDHVMGLFRQFWIPAGGSPRDGAYVTFPAEELLALLRLEAVRAGAYVVGEDLGTVEPRVREALVASNIAGTKVLWFEEHPPATWPENSLATVTTHDLPTIAAVWSGTDGEPEQADRLRAVAAGDTVADVIAAANRALLDSPARLRLMTTDDLCAATERPNHPGTIDQPNWRIRLPLPVDEITL